MNLMSFRSARMMSPSRRDMIQWGSLGLLGVGLGSAFTSRAAQAYSDDSRNRVDANVRPAAKSCILVWLDGGPSHLETFDLKPRASAEVRGPFRPIATAVPGIEISEHLPKLAQSANQFQLVRSVTSPLGEHGLANQFLLTGYKPTSLLEYPSFGAVLTQQRGSASELPAYVAIPETRAAGAGFLGSKYEPFETGGDPGDPAFRVKNLEATMRMDAGRLERRQQFLAEFDAAQRSLDANKGDAGETIKKAFELTRSANARKAFDLTAEPDSVRHRYGTRRLGQSCLLARRLVERGVPFVTVFHTGWDTHENLSLNLRDGYAGAKEGVGLIPLLDLALSALLEDLANRRLLEETLVIVMGEFGRTPKINTRGGRDHWPRVFSVLAAGGGIPAGTIHGESDRMGESPHDVPVTPVDLAASIYRRLGVDTTRELITPDGRPILINAGGVPIPGW